MDSLETIALTNILFWRWVFLIFSVLALIVSSLKPSKLFFFPNLHLVHENASFWVKII